MATFLHEYVEHKPVCLPFLRLGISLKAGKLWQRTSLRTQDRLQDL